MVQTINLQCRIAFALLSFLRTLWALEDILRDVSHLDRFDDSSPIFSDSTTLSNSRSTLSSSPSLSTNAGVESGQYLLSDPILDTWLLSLTVDEWWLSHVRFFFFLIRLSHIHTLQILGSMLFQTGWRVMNFVNQSQLIFNRSSPHELRQFFLSSPLVVSWPT